MKNRILVEQFYRYFMISTMQWYPHTDAWENGKIRKAVFRVGQLLALCLILCSFFFDIGYFGKISTPISVDWEYKITRIRNVLWELRWLFGNLIGLWYFNTRHFEWLLANTFLPEHIWAKFRKEAVIFFVALVILIIMIPVGVNVLVINDLMKTGETWRQQVIHICGFFFCRYSSMPVFLVLIAILRLLYFDVLVVGARIKEGLLNGDKDEWGQVAEGEVRKGLGSILHLKKLISCTENRIKYFILFHLILLLFTAFFGVLSCLERLHIHVNTAKVANRTLETMDRGQVLILNRARDIRKSDEKIDKAMILIADITRKHKRRLENDDTMKKMLNVMNETLASVSESSKANTKLALVHTGATNQVMKTVFEEQLNVTRVYLEIGMDAVESALLYGIPLFLLIRIDNAVGFVLDMLINLQGERGNNGFMMSQCVWEVINFTKTLKGIRIFGFQSSLFRTLILTFAGPILLSFVHSLFAEAKIPK